MPRDQFKATNEIREVASYAKDSYGDWLVDCPHCNRTMGLEKGDNRGEQFQDKFCGGWLQVSYTPNRISLDKWEETHP